MGIEEDFEERVNYRKAYKLVDKCMADITRLFALTDDTDSGLNTTIHKYLGDSWDALYTARHFIERGAHNERIKYLRRNTDESQDR